MKTACHACGIVLNIEDDNDFKMVCPQCATVLYGRNINMFYALMFSITSLLFMLPAMLFPFLEIQIQGNRISATLFESAKVLNDDGLRLAALIVICTAFLFPLIYMVFTAYLSFDSIVAFTMPLSEKIAKVVESMKHWQMVDVFIIGILVSVVKLVGMADINLGKGFYMLACECFFMVLAGSYYDSRQFWFKR